MNNFLIKEKITKVLQLWQKNNIFTSDLIDKLIKLTDLMSKNQNIDYETLLKGKMFNWFIKLYFIKITISYKDEIKDDENVSEETYNLL